MKENISIIIPAYNEEKTIKGVVLSSLSTLKELANKYEVLVIDDGSKDKTGAVLDSLALKNKNFRVIHHIHNKGIGISLKDGFFNAKYDLIFDLPADGQQDPKELKSFLPLIKEADIVAGWRKKREDPFKRILGARLYNSFLCFLFGIKIRDIDWVKLYRKSVFDRIKIESNSSFVIAEIIIKAHKKGCVIKEVPVGHKPRMCGKASGYKLSIVSKQLFDLFKTWMKLTFEKN